MIEILGLLGGAATRLFPAILGFFKEGRDLKYELLRMEKEHDIEVLRGKNRLNEIQGMAQASIDTNWSQALATAIDKQTTVTGDKWLDRINVSVRPILTYWWCVVLYTANKILFAVSAYQAHMGLETYGPILFSEFDKAVVGSIIGFWFVDRALRK